MFLFSHSLAIAALVAQSAAPTCNDSLSSRVRARLAPMLAERAKAGTFSGVVLVACNGTTVYSAAYGLANRTTGVKNTLDTRFNLGSMNKMWTAIAIAQLVEQGKVDVNAPVGRYLPDLPNKAVREQVLVRHLLSHTSGLGSYFKRGYLRDRVTLAKASDLLRFFIDDSLSFAPGSSFEYSNAGFAVLGAIIERVSGVSYFDYMRRNVLEKAGMKGAEFVTLPLTGNQYAMGYATPPGTTDTTENTSMLERSSSPAGGAFASASDIVAFSRALWSGKLVGLPLVKQFTTGVAPMAGIKYAFGFGDGVVGGVRTVGHNGGAPGVGTDFVSLPDSNIDIVVLTNIEMPIASEILEQALSAITGAPPRKFITPGAGAPFVRPSPK